MQELADVIQRVERTKHIGSNDHAGSEIAEHSAHAERAAERRSDGGRS